MKNKINILFFLRLYSGLEKSLLSNNWSPAGVPAISKLLENINNEKFNPLVIFYSFDKKKKFIKNKIYNLKNFNISFIFIRPPIFFYIFPYRIFVLLSYFYFSLKTLLLTFKYRSRVLYTDRSNIFGAALCKIINKKVKIVIRFLGMPKPTFDHMKSKGIFPFLTRLSLKIKYDLIIGTEDGSSIKSFFDTYLKNQPSKFLILNGVLKNKFSNLMTKKKIKILSVSRLEKNKNIDILIKSINHIPIKLRKNFYLEIIGDGKERTDLELLLKNLKLNKFVKFIGDRDNYEVFKHFTESDIYVSCNEFGQLSNSNLEAISSGLCVIFVKTNVNNDHRIRKKLLKTDNVIWVEKDSSGLALSKQIIKLIMNQKKIRQYKKNTRQLSKVLPSVGERIKWEIDKIENLNEVF